MDITTSYTVPVIVHHNLITDLPSIEKAHKKWTVIRPKHVREKIKNKKRHWNENWENQLIL